MTVDENAFKLFHFMLTSFLYLLTAFVQSRVVMMEDEEDALEDETRDYRQKVKTRTILAFGVVGFLVDFFFTISISASQDILQATKIPTSLVLLATAGPACLTTVLYPYLFQRIAVSLASCAIFVFSVTGMLITSLAHDPKVKLIGVCMVSLGIGSTETVFVPLAGSYGGSTINGFALGSGIAFVVAPLSYIGKLHFSSYLLHLRVPMFETTRAKKSEFRLGKY